MKVSPLSKKYRFPTFEQKFTKERCQKCGRKTKSAWGYCVVDTVKYISELGKQLEAQNE